MSSLAPTISHELELEVLQLMLKLRDVDDGAGAAAYDQLRTKLRQALITAPSSMEAIQDTQRLVSKFNKKLLELKGVRKSKKEKRVAKRQREREEQIGRRSKFIDDEAGVGSEDDEADE